MNMDIGQHLQAPSRGKNYSRWEATAMETIGLETTAMKRQQSDRLDCKWWGGGMEERVGLYRVRGPGSESTR